MSSTSILRSWKSISFPSLLSELSNTVAELNSNKESSSLSRIKDLADATKTFQQLDESSKLTQIQPLLKRYQDLVSNLFKRSKSSEKAIKSLANRLSLAQDPVPLLEALLTKQEYQQDQHDHAEELSRMLVKKEDELVELSKKYDELVLTLLPRSLKPVESPRPSRDNQSHDGDVYKQLLTLQREHVDLLMKMENFDNQLRGKTEFIEELNQINTSLSRENESLKNENAALSNQIQSIKTSTINQKPLSTEETHRPVNNPQSFSNQSDALISIKKHRDRLYSRNRNLESLLDQANSKVSYLEKELSMRRSNMRSEYDVEHGSLMIPTSQFKNSNIDMLLLSFSKFINENSKKRRFFYLYVSILHIFLFLNLIF
ncbi:hypothetical protein P9112_009261 [Eukaryota sp. TZLM1-RC]